MNKNNEIEIELTQNFYEELVIKTIDPKVDLENLFFHTIVQNNSGSYGVLWIKKVFKKGEKFFANGQVQITVETHEEAVSILNGLKKELESNGIQTKN